MISLLTYTSSDTNCSSKRVGPEEVLSVEPSSPTFSGEVRKAEVSAFGECNSLSPDSGWKTIYKFIEVNERDTAAVERLSRDHHSLSREISGKNSREEYVANWKISC